MVTATKAKKAGNELIWDTTQVFTELLRAWVSGKRRSLQEGGTAASKTWSVLQFLIHIAEKAEDPMLISVVSESLPHLKRGAIRDFFNILDESQDNNPYWSKTEFTYKRKGWKGSIEFFGADDAGKVRGPRREVLFMNEGNNIPWETARGLDIRTSKFTIIDWNPVSEFWAHEFWLNEPENAYTHSTYLDAKDVLPEQVTKDIESYEFKDPNWWNIYGLGLIGKIEGLVYPIFEQVDELPDAPLFYGLDYGSLVDPTVLTAHVIEGDKLYSKELFYIWDTQITNNKISMQMQLAGVSRLLPIYPDPDEPKSAVELRELGWTIGETIKGKGSVIFGIKAVNNFYQHWTKGSLNCIKDQRNCRYIPDKDGILTDNITHRWSHGMDSRRYAVASYSKPVLRKSKHSIRM